VIICASHVGVSEQGHVGKLQRTGMEEESSACGAAIAAYNFLRTDPQPPNRLNGVLKRDPNIHKGFSDPYDQQQCYIMVEVAKRYEEIAFAQNPMAALANIVFDAILRDVLAIIPEDRHFPLAILGGIQINLENFQGDADEDYFFPKSFTLYDHGKATDLSPSFKLIVEKKSRQIKGKKRQIKEKNRTHQYSSS